MSKTGVRFIYKEQNNKFSQDLEPEYISFSKDERKAYICLQVRFSSDFYIHIGLKPWRLPLAGVSSVHAYSSTTVNDDMPLNSINYYFNI